MVGEFLRMAARNWWELATSVDRQTGREACWHASNILSLLLFFTFDCDHLGADH